MSQKEFTQIYPKPGWVEHNPMEIWSSQLAVAAAAERKVGVGPVGANIEQIDSRFQQHRDVVGGLFHRFSPACRSICRSIWV